MAWASNIKKKTGQRISQSFMPISVESVRREMYVFLGLVCEKIERRRVRKKNRAEN